jgi:uncharacterized protein (DUF2062 family)
MPRKLFRRYLPSHESVRQNRWLRFLGPSLKHHNLWHLHRRSVAGGFAVGLFCGLVPGPLQVISAALFAVIFRVNLPVAVITTVYTNPLTIVPLYIVAYELGMLVTGGNAGGVPHADLDLFSLPLGQWIPALTQWLVSMGRPFVFGLVLLATMLAAGGYLLVRCAWRLHAMLSWRRRVRDRAARNRH